MSNCLPPLNQFIASGLHIDLFDLVRIHQSPIERLQWPLPPDICELDYYRHLCPDCKYLTEGPLCILVLVSSHTVLFVLEMDEPSEA
jgi:hypothetical protein